MMDLFVKISYARREKLLSATDRMPFRKGNRCLILMAFDTASRPVSCWGCACRILILQEDGISGASNGFQRVTPSFPIGITY